MRAVPPLWRRPAPSKSGRRRHSYLGVLCAPPDWIDARTLTLWVCRMVGSTTLAGWRAFRVSLLPVVTTLDVENYLSPYFATQSIEAMAPKFPNWLGRLHEYGVVTVPLAPGSESAQYIDLFALQASRNPDVRVRGHDVRDTLPKIRPYKGR